jgi:hypothetical protein
MKKKMIMMKEEHKLEESRKEGRRFPATTTKKKDINTTQQTNKFAINTQNAQTALTNFPTIELFPHQMPCFVLVPPIPNPTLNHPFKSFIAESKEPPTKSACLILLLPFEIMNIIFKNNIC